MKKRFFAVALATTMALSTVMTANAATIEGAWWAAWTEGYELTDAAPLEFDIEVKGGAAVWNNVAAVFANVKTDGTVAPSADNFAGYKEYAVIRGDNWGWGGGDNKTVDGSDITYEGGIAEMTDDAEWIATMADCHIDATITKNGNDVTMVYNGTGANGKTFTRTARFSADMSVGSYIFFACDGAEVTVTPVTKEEESTTTEEESTTTTTTEEESTTASDVNDSPSTDDPDTTDAVSGTTTVDGKEVTVEVEGFKDGTTLKIENVTAVERVTKYTEAAKKLAEISKLEVFDITPSTPGVDYDTETGKYKVTMDLPATLDATKKIVVYRVEKDDTTLTALTTTVSNGKATFETDHFSTYIVAELDEVETTTAAAEATTAAATTTVSEKAPVKTGDVAPVATLVVVALGACAAVVASKKKLAK